MRTSRGFTLIELLIAVVLLGIVSTGLYRILVTSQRVSRSQMQQSDLQANVRTGALVITNELREIGYDSATNAGAVAAQADLLQMNAQSVRYYASRGFGVACNLQPSGQIFIEKPVFGQRDPLVTDKVLVFIDGVFTLAADDMWITLAPTGVNPNSNCGATPAIEIVTPSFAAYGALTHGSGVPVRYVEEMEMGLYVADGKSWLGLRSVSAGEVAYQPVLGPLADGNGVQFRYLDKNDAVTATPMNVRTIEVTLRGRSDGAMALAGQNVMAERNQVLTTRVALRNNLRP